MTAADRRYSLRTAALMGAYVAMCLAIILGAFDDVRPPGAWLLAGAVAAPVVAQLWATLAYMHDADEVVAALTAKRFILAAGLTIAGFSAWGFAETFANAPRIAGWFIYPAFWAAFAAVTPFTSSTRP